MLPGWWFQTCFFPFHKKKVVIRNPLTKSIIFHDSEIAPPSSDLYPLNHLIFNGKLNKDLHSHNVGIPMVKSPPGIITNVE